MPPYSLAEEAHTGRRAAANATGFSRLFVPALWGPATCRFLILREGETTAILNPSRGGLNQVAVKEGTWGVQPKTPEQTLHLR